MSFHLAPMKKAIRQGLKNSFYYLVAYAKRKHTKRERERAKITRNSCIITNQLSQKTDDEDDDDGTRSPSRVIKINLKCQNGTGGAEGGGEYKESQEGQWTAESRELPCSRMIKRIS